MSLRFTRVRHTSVPRVCNEGNDTEDVTCNEMSSILSDPFLPIGFKGIFISRCSRDCLEFKIPSLEMLLVCLSVEEKRDVTEEAVNLVFLSNNAVSGQNIVLADVFEEPRDTFEDLADTLVEQASDFSLVDVLDFLVRFTRKA
ncbi:unnamed protein product [Pneumocystis jirovecii]|uniref:Uncharacterized protein n=1 Tax=Pneumocystis jirovecii TaxID=42068 RepID=L0PGW8_PNEJI|nr:unnamed protein product [Pneumocystis jirovecii]